MSSENGYIKSTVSMKSGLRDRNNVGVKIANNKKESCLNEVRS